MPRFNANLTMLFQEFDFLDRFEQASLEGFKGVEYLFPYAFDKQALADRLQQYNLKQVLFNLPAGDWADGDRGVACDPGRVDEFREGVDLAIEYAKALECCQLNVLAGLLPEGCSRELATETLVENLRYASDHLQRAGIRCLMEAINTRDIPGFLVCHSAQAIDIMDRVDSDNLFFQYDIYHMQVMEGNLAQTIQTLLPRIAHMQLADNPGRHEPGTGEINYTYLFEMIDKSDYEGWMGCEYMPAHTTREGLSWVRPYL